MKTICKEFKQTVIIVTHDLEIAYGADAVIKLKDGKIVDNIRSNGNEISLTEMIFYVTYHFAN